jgi:hypothetical protein
VNFATFKVTTFIEVTFISLATDVRTRYHPQLSLAQQLCNPFLFGLNAITTVCVDEM